MSHLQKLNSYPIAESWSISISDLANGDLKYTSSPPEPETEANDSNSNSQAQLLNDSNLQDPKPPSA